MVVGETMTQGSLDNREANLKVLKEVVSGGE